MIDDNRLAQILEAATTDGKADHVLLPKTEVWELVQAYCHHKRVLPLHQAIARACKDLGY
jgi:hypothetical protein